MSESISDSIRNTYAPQAQDQYGNTIEGAVDFDQLQHLSDSGQLNQYTWHEFGLGHGYEQYITPIESEPFDLIKEMQENKLGQRSLQTRTTQNKLFGEVGGARQKSNLAFSGSIESALNQSKNMLMQEHQLGQREIDTQTDQSIFDEEQRQLERFYDDIGAVLQLNAAEDAAANSGGKK